MFYLGENEELDRHIEAAAINRADTAADALLEEIFADTATDLASWERVYDITPESTATEAQRRQEIIAVVRATGGLSRSYFENLAKGLGYTIGAAGSTDPHVRLLEGEYPPFRAGVSVAGDAVWDQTSGASTYTVVVSGTSITTDTALQRLFNRLAPAHIEFTYQNE